MAAFNGLMGRESRWTVATSDIRISQNCIGERRPPKAHVFQANLMALLSLPEFNTFEEFLLSWNQMDIRKPIAIDGLRRSDQMLNRRVLHFKGMILMKISLVPCVLR